MMPGLGIEQTKSGADSQENKQAQLEEFMPFLWKENATLLTQHKRKQDTIIQNTLQS